MERKPVSVREPLVLIGAFNLAGIVVSTVTFLLFSFSLAMTFEIILLLGGAILLIAGSYTRRGSEDGSSRLFSPKIILSGLILIVESFGLSSLLG
ncbi:MAG: hypothetical protein ACE5KG_04735 [Nitrososphaerales archaeon]